MSNTSETYIQSLKQIKELEEKVQSEIEARRRQVEDDMAKLESQLKDAVAQAKSGGEKMVEQSIVQAKQKAQIEADKIMSEARERSKNLRLNQRAAKQVIEILLSGI